MRSVLLLASTAAAIVVESSGVFAQQLIEPYSADRPYYDEYVSTRRHGLSLPERFSRPRPGASGELRRIQVLGRPALR